MKLLKSRKAQNSKRGIYLQDRELTETSFKVGTNFKYIVDHKNKKMIIVPSEEGTKNTVSKRKLKNLIKPVIDIRKKDALSLFKECDYLQVQIYGEQIIVEGFEEIGEASSELKRESVKRSKVVHDITHILEVKKKASIVLSTKELEKAVGHHSYSQLDIFDFISSDTSSTSKFSTFKEALKGIDIPLKVISLFSGAGVFDYGFKESGFDIIFALEKDKDIVKTYKHNLGDHIVEADITKFDKSQFPYAPIVIGGSPCKGFSNSNRKSNYLDNPNNLLVKEYIKSVKAINPYVFVLENVPQLLSAGEGKFVQEIENELSDYEITKGILTASSFGDPQDRKRAFVIGSRIGKIQLPIEPIVRAYNTVRNAFKGLTRQIPNQLDISQPKDITLERIKHVKPGGNIFDIPEEIRPKGKHSDMYKRLEWDRTSITIVNPRKAMLLHPEEDRIISIREACRLFSLPDSFIFKGGLSAMQESIANSVPVKLSKAIANVVKQAITKYNLSQQTI